MPETTPVNHAPPGGKRWWKKEGPSTEHKAHPRREQPCPKCYLADLDYDSLFRLRCPICGYVAECGAFT